jgi:hypothetical protein
MTLHTDESPRSASEDGMNRPAARPHLRLRTPHPTHSVPRTPHPAYSALRATHPAYSALRALRAELESLYDELTAALLPDPKGKK